MVATRRYSRWVVALGALLLVESSLSFAADEEEIDRTPQDCVSLPRVSRTEVIDDQTILFYQRGGKVYLNHLPRKCGGLAREDRFMYKVTTTRLCSSDTITVLEHWGAGFTPGFTCPALLGYLRNLSQLSATGLSPSLAFFPVWFT